MSLKSSRIIAFVGTFILAFVFHFAYQVFPNFVFSIFFPVNESIWEHMKILYSSIIIYGIIDYFIGKRFDVHYSNFIFNLFFCSFISVLVYLSLFLPLYYKIGESMFLSIGILFITYIIVYYISYYILKHNEFDYNFIWIIFITLGFILFFYLTYNPIKNQLFFDTKDEIYGIKKRNN